MRRFCKSTDTSRKRTPMPSKRLVKYVTQSQQQLEKTWQDAEAQQQARQDYLHLVLLIDARLEMSDKVLSYETSQPSNPFPPLRRTVCVK